MTGLRQMPRREVARVSVGCDLVRVSVSEGVVSLVWTLDPPLPGSAGAPWLNRHARRGTAAQLRALAAVLDGLAWVDDGTVEGI